MKVGGHDAWQREPRPGTAGVYRSRSNNDTGEPRRGDRPPRRGAQQVGGYYAAGDGGARPDGRRPARVCTGGGHELRRQHPSRPGQGTAALPPACRGRMARGQCPGGQRPRRNRDAIGGGQWSAGAARQVSDPPPNPHPPPDTPGIFASGRSKGKA